MRQQEIGATVAACLFLHRQELLERDVAAQPAAARILESATGGLPPRSKRSDDSIWRTGSVAPVKRTTLS
jgi:hypothetical protein